MLKKIMIPVAAFALTATAASAFTGTEWMSKINLTDSQRDAVEEAQQIREEAHTRAQEVLTNAGIDAAKMREVMHEARHTEREAVHAAIEAKDFNAFRAAVTDSPLAVIDTQSEFDRLLEAHELMESGDRDGARAIMDELGVESPGKGMGMGGMRGGMQGFGNKEGRGGR